MQGVIATSRLGRAGIVQLAVADIDPNPNQPRTVFDPAALEELTVDETAPKEDRLPRGLYIYMAEEGESLWEIARRYNTSEARIREDNGEMGECCPAGPLLIPV